MSNPFYDFLASLEDMVFQTPEKEAVEKLLTLTQGRMPEMFADVYTKQEPLGEAASADFVFYGLGRMADENTEYIPGANLLPLGLFTFASTDDGDSICFDMNDPAFPVYHVSHETMNGEDDIMFEENGKWQSVPFNYENVVRYAHKIADSFAEFVSEQAADEE